MTQPSGRQFFDHEWSVYDQVLDHNYMFHDDIYRDVRRLLADSFDRRPFAVLDLGCGSARHLSSALRGLRVARYVGYDLSDEALGHAAANLAGLGCPVELRKGDLLEGLKASAEPFDLILCSFALHHLRSADKAAFFRSAYRKLEDAGMFLLIDVMREEDEDLPVYLDNYCGWLRSRYKALSPEALDALCAHIRNNDFAETVSEIRAMAVGAGFNEYREVHRFRWHHTWRFDKSHARTR